MATIFTTVKDLLDTNPLMIQAALLKDSFIVRISGQNHLNKIRKYDEIIPDLDRKISYVIQTLLYGFKFGISICSMRFIASRVGPSYWRVASFCIVPGILVGVLTRKLSMIECIKFQGDIYASYKTRFKILQPLHDMAFNIAIVAIGIFAYLKIPPLGYFSAIAATLLLSSEVGAIFRQGMEKLMGGSIAPIGTY